MEIQESEMEIQNDFFNFINAIIECSADPKIIFAEHRNKIENLEELRLQQM